MSVCVVVKKVKSRRILSTTKKTGVIYRFNCTEKNILTSNFVGHTDFVVYISRCW